MSIIKRLFNLRVLILLPIVGTSLALSAYLYFIWFPNSMLSHTGTDSFATDPHTLLAFLIVANITLSSLLLGLLQYVIISPIRAITQAAIAMTRGDYSPVIPTNVTKELSALGEAFQFMRDTIKEGKQRMESAVTKATASNEAKSDFLANMSHELRTPMNGVLGMVEMLHDTPLNEEQKQFATQIQTSADSLLTLLNDILDFSKIEAHALTLERIPFETKDVVDGVIAMLSPLARDKNLELIAQIDENIPPSLMGDPARLRQVLINLVGNAIKFTPNGQVSIYIHRSEDASQENLNIAVIDTGIGIPENKLDAIFQKFTQADASNTRQFGGTGLGLAITQSLVELMGGQIGVESTLGVGSKFHFNLPCLYPTAEDLSKLQALQQPHAHAGNNNARLTPESTQILLVEDDPINQEVARRLLGKLGFQHVDTADNGQDAVAMFLPDMHNLILMDCQMPGIDGFEATQEIRAQEEDTDRHVPIIALTANAMVGDRERCLAVGMDEYLSKPIKLDKLKNILTPWVNFTDMSAPTPAINVPLMAEAPIDFEHLAAFTDGDREQEKELFELFFETANTCLRQLYDNIETAENDVWKAVAHRLKGSAANLGANDLSEAARIAEETSDGDIPEKQAQYTKIYEAFIAIETFAHQHYGL